MKTAVKILLILGGGLIATTLTIAAIIAFSQKEPNDKDSPYVYNVTPKEKVFIDYEDTEISSLSELMTSLVEKS